MQLELTDAPPPRESLDRLRPGVPIVARDGSRAGRGSRPRWPSSAACSPPRLCFRQIMPVDEVVTMIQFFRADEPFARLMLDDADRARLDRLWDELHYVSQDGIRVYQNLDQMLGFASQEGQTAKVEAWRKPITAAYEAAVKVQAASEPKQIDALLAFAARAYRRPLSDREEEELRGALSEAPRRGARRTTRRSGWCWPASWCRRRSSTGSSGPAPGTEARPVSDWELASRLSYFLWASMPDDELTRLAAAGRLHDPDVLAAQARRMVRDERARGLATEFACQWLEIRDFDTHDEKSERHFPTFAQVRPDLYEEAVRFFADLFARDGSVLELIDADHTFLNESLAKHYGIPGVTGPEWRRVDGVQGARPRRRAGPGRDPGEAVGRVADQPDPAGQLAAREPAGRAAAQAAQERPAAPRRRGGDRRPDRPPARREAPQRRLVRRLPQPHRPLRLRPRSLRPDRPVRDRTTWAAARWTPAPS